MGASINDMPATAISSCLRGTVATGLRWMLKAAQHYTNENYFTVVHCLYSPNVTRCEVPCCTTASFPSAVVLFCKTFSLVRRSNY